MKNVSKKGMLEVKLNFPNVSLNLHSREPNSCLKELNRIIHTLKAIEFNRDYVEDEDPVLFRLGFISDELKQNHETMEFVKDALTVEDSFRQKKFSLDTKKILDFQTNKYTNSIDNIKLKTKVESVCKDMEHSRYILAHIIGTHSTDETRSIIETLKSKMPKAEIKTQLTNKDVLGKTIVELLFFGPFEEDLYF